MNDAAYSKMADAIDALGEDWAEDSGLNARGRTAAARLAYIETLQHEIAVSPRERGDIIRREHAALDGLLAEFVRAVEVRPQRQADMEV